MFSKLKVLLTTGIILWLFAGCATIYQKNVSQFNVFTISQINQDSAIAKEIGEEINLGKTIVIKVSKGESIPLKLNINIPVVAFEKSENSIVLNSDEYISISKTDGLQVSPDGQQWASIGNMRALKKLYNFRKGQVSVGFSITKENGPQISIGVNAQ